MAEFLMLRHTRQSRARGFSFPVIQLSHAHLTRRDVFDWLRPTIFTVVLFRQRVTGQLGSTGDVE